MKVQVEKEENCYQGFFHLKRFTLRHELFAGGMSPPIQRELLGMRRAVAVLLYDPEREQLVMIEQFRIGAIHDPEGAWVLELPAGLVEEGESDEEMARRECMEEAGIEIRNLEFIREYRVAPAATTERIGLYCAQVEASQAGGIHGLPEEGEDIRVRVLSVDEALRELDGGRINSSCPIIAMQWFQMNRERLKLAWSKSGVPV